MRRPILDEIFNKLFNQLDTQYERMEASNLEALDQAKQAIEAHYQARFREAIERAVKEARATHSGDKDGIAIMFWNAAIAKVQENLLRELGIEEKS